MLRRIRGRTAKEGESERRDVLDAEMNNHKRCRDSGGAMKVTTGDRHDTGNTERQGENPDIVSQQALFPAVKRARYVPVLKRQARRKGKRSGIGTEQGTSLQEEAGDNVEGNSCEEAKVENIKLDDEEIPKSKITVNKNNDLWPLPGIAANESLKQENIQLDFGMEQQKAMGKSSTEICDSSFNTMSTKVTSEGGAFEIIQGAFSKPLEAIEFGNKLEKQDSGQNQKKEAVSKAQSDQAEPLVKQSSVFQREGCDEFDVQIENSESPGPTAFSLQVHVDGGMNGLGTESMGVSDIVIVKPKCDDSLIGKTETGITTDVFYSSPDISAGSAENSKIILDKILDNCQRLSANELSVFQTMPVSFEHCLKSSLESQGLTNDMLHSAEVLCSDDPKSLAKKPELTDYRDPGVDSACCDVIVTGDKVTNPVFIINSERKFTDGNDTNGSNTGSVECKDAASDARIKTEDCAIDNVELAAPAVDFQRVDDNGLKICAVRDAMYPQGGDRKVFEQSDKVDLKGKPAFNDSGIIQQKGEKTELETMTLKDKTQSTVSIAEQSTRATIFQRIITTTEAESTHSLTVEKRMPTSVAGVVKERVKLESSDMVRDEISTKYLGDEELGQHLITSQNVESRRSNDGQTENVSSRVKDIGEGNKDENLCDEATKGCCVGSSTKSKVEEFSEQFSHLSSNFQEDFNDDMVTFADSCKKGESWNKKCQEPTINYGREEAVTCYKVPQYKDSTQTVRRLRQDLCTLKHKRKCKLSVQNGTHISESYRVLRSNSHSEATLVLEVVQGQHLAGVFLDFQVQKAVRRIENMKSRGPRRHTEIGVSLRPSLCRGGARNRFAWY